MAKAQYISQLTKAFYNAYYGNPTKYFYIKGFSFGKSDTYDIASDFALNIDNIEIRQGLIPSWNDVNQNSYKDSFYTAQYDAVEGCVFNYINPILYSLEGRTFSYSNGIFTLISGNPLPVISDATLETNPYKYISYYINDTDRATLKLLSTTSNTMTIDTTYSPYNGESSAMTFTGFTDFQFQTPENNFSFRMVIPHKLFKTDGITELNFDFDELYVYFALYDKTDTWDSINEKFPSETVYFGYYANLTNSETFFLDYNHNSTTKYYYDVNLKLTGLFDRTTLNTNNNLVLFNTPEINNRHIFVSFETPTVYPLTDSFTINDGTDARTYKLVKSVSTYFSGSKLEGYILEGDNPIKNPSSSNVVSAVTTDYSYLGNKINTVVRNILYLPTEPVKNNEDDTRNKIYYGMTHDEVETELGVDPKTYPFRLYADVKNINLYELMTNSLYTNKQYYVQQTRTKQLTKYSNDMKKLYRMNMQEFYYWFSELNPPFPIENPVTLKEIEISTSTRSFQQMYSYTSLKMFSTDESNVVIAPIYYDEINYTNKYIFTFDLTDLQTEINLYNLGLFDKEITIPNFELKFEFLDTMNEINFFYFVILDASDNIILAYELRNRNSIRVPYKYGYKYGYANNYPADESIPYNKVKITKILKYRD